MAERCHLQLFFLSLGKLSFVTGFCTRFLRNVSLFMLSQSDILVKFTPRIFVYTLVYKNSLSVFIYEISRKNVDDKIFN